MYSSGVSSRGTIRFGHMSEQIGNDHIPFVPVGIDVCATLVQTTAYAPKPIILGGFHGSHFPVGRYVLRRFPRRYLHVRWIRNIAVGNF